MANSSSSRQPELDNATSWGQNGLAWASGKAVRCPADFKSLWLLGIQARGCPTLGEVLTVPPFPCQRTWAKNSYQT